MDPETAASLAVGDTVLVSGRIVTGRDQVHRYLASGGESPLDLTGMVLYHCGPIVVGDAGSHRVVAAGPTTSMREEPYQADVIARFKPGAVMGKGGMGERTSKALVEHGIPYLHATGGAAVYLASCIERVEGVYLEEFGRPEAMWVLCVRDLPALVTMDGKGASLHRHILDRSASMLKRVLESTLTPPRT